MKRGKRMKEKERKPRKKHRFKEVNRVVKKIHWKRVFLVVFLFSVATLIPLYINHNISTINQYENEIESKNNELNTKNNELEEKEHLIQCLELQQNDLITELENERNKTDELNTKVDSLQKDNEKLKSESTKVQVTSRGGSAVRDSSSGYIKFEATGYCSCSKCCGKSTGITASGTKATAGRTVAMSKDYSFGTKVEIQGLGTYTVEDRGGAIQGNRIDIYFGSHQEALNFGRRTVYLKVIN